RDRPWDSKLGEDVEQSLSPWQRAHVADSALVCLGVKGPEPVGLRRADVPACLAHQGTHEKAAAHSYSPMDAPDRQRDANALKGFPPCQHVLVHAVEQRSVEVEQD